MKRINSCLNKPEKTSTAKINKIYLLVIYCFHIVHLMLQKTSLIVIEVKDCMERFCKDLKEHATEIINYEKKEMIAMVRYICKKGLSTDDDNKKSKIIVTTQENIEELLIVFVI